MVLFFILLTDHICKFVYIEQMLDHWDKSLLVMANDSFDVPLGLVW